MAGSAVSAELCDDHQKERRANGEPARLSSHGLDSATPGGGIADSQHGYLARDYHHRETPTVFQATVSPSLAAGTQRQCRAVVVSRISDHRLGYACPRPSVIFRH
jgi:hypothetical protein